LSAFAPAQSALPPDAASALFDSGALQDFWLTVAPEDWALLKANYLENTYYTASFTWRDTTLGRIGIRSRGNGSRSGVKPALKLDFTKYGTTTFLGLKSLVLKNLIQDPPMLREYLALAVHRQMGLPASRTSYVRLMVNGEPMGLYLAVEPLDKVFLKRNYGVDNGDLWSLDWGFEYNFEDLGPEPSAYCPVPFKPETNDKNPNVAPIMDLAARLATAPDEDLVGTVAGRMDWDNLVGHLAADSYVGEMDGFLGVVGMNNFYLYRPLASANEPNPRIQLLPWDKNATFFWFEAPLIYDFEANRLVSRLMAHPEFTGPYRSKMAEIAETMGGEDGWLMGVFNAAESLIRSAALEDKLKPYTNEEFEQTVEGARFFIADRYLQVKRQLEAPGSETPKVRISR
jgi:spore coat protein CotH